MNHEGVRQLLSAYALDELTGGQRRPIDEHLVGCLSCRQELVRMQRVLALAGDMAQVAVADLAGVQAAKQVLDAIQAQPSTPDERESLSKSIPLRWLTAAAAIVLLCISLVLLNTGKHPPGTPDPAVKRMRPDTPQPALEHDQAARNRIQLQLAQARGFFEEKNISGLLDLLERGEGQTQIAVADYLAQLGSREALPLLNRLAAAWQGDPIANPFAAAIAKILAAIAEPNEFDLAEPAGGVSDPNALGAAPTAVEPNSSADTAIAKEPNEGSTGVAVRVIDDEGIAIPGVDVSVESSGGFYYFRYGPGMSNPNAAHYLTDSNGVCLLTKALPNASKLQLSKQGYVSITKNLTITEPNDTLEFRLEEAIVIRGMVVNQAGEPVAGAKVYVSGHDPNRAKDRDSPRIKLDYSQMTDANGLWQCSSMPRVLDEIEIWIIHPHYMRLKRQIPDLALALRDLTVRRPTFVLTRGNSWEGHVYDEAGRPIEKARVTLGSGYSDFSTYTMEETDPNGFFSFQGMPEDQSDWAIVIRAIGYAPEFRDCPAEADPEPLAITMERGRTINGRVVDIERSPLQEVRVNIESWRSRNVLKSVAAMTDEEGRFLLEGVPFDEVSLRFEHSDYSMSYRVVFPEEDTLEQVLEPRPKTMRTLVRVSVLDARTGEAVQGFELIRGSLLPEGNEILWRRNPGSRPKYEQNERKTGRSTVTVTESDQSSSFIIFAKGYVPVQTRLIDPNEGEISMELYLEEGSGPKGHVFDAMGHPVFGAEIYIVNCGIKLQLMNGRVYNKVKQNHMLSDVYGQFDFGPQFEPQAFIALSEEGFGWVTAEQFNQTEQITLMPWSRISGQYVKGMQTDSDHDPTIHLLPEDALERYVDLSYSVTVSKQGAFHLDRVVSGAFRLAYEHYHVDPGQDLEIPLDGRVRNVLGQIVDPWEDGATLRESDFQLIRLQPEITAEAQETLMAVQMMESHAFKRWLGEEASHAHGQGIDLLAECPVQPNLSGRFRLRNLRAGRYLLLGWIKQVPLSGQADASASRQMWHEFVLPSPNANEAGEPFDLGMLEFN